MASIKSLLDLNRLFPPKPGELAAVEDVTMGDEPIGTGLLGERFDLKCPSCDDGLMRLRNSKHGLFYGCMNYPTCNTTHGAHLDGSPLGTPGDKDTRKARISAHNVFDRLWKAQGHQKPLMTRSQAYSWMRRALRLSDNEAHIGKFTIAQCHALVEAVRKQYPGVRNVWDRLVSNDDDF